MYPNWTPTSGQMQAYIDEFDNTDENMLAKAIRLHFRKSKYSSTPKPADLRNRLEEVGEMMQNEDGYVRKSKVKWYMVSFLDSKNYMSVMEFINDESGAMNAAEIVNGQVEEQWYEEGVKKIKILREGVHLPWQKRIAQPEEKKESNTRFSKNVKELQGSIVNNDTKREVIL
tara:strand:+ start:77 stop:592 length:516 start_codon:yes stop_codon:yes gene_type:complete